MGGTDEVAGTAPDFVNTMPRDPKGKPYKRRLRDPYREGHARAMQTGLMSCQP